MRLTAYRIKKGLAALAKDIKIPNADATSPLFISYSFLQGSRSEPLPRVQVARNQSSMILVAHTASLSLSSFVMIPYWLL